MSSGGKHKQPRVATTLSVDGNIQVSVFNQTISAKNATIQKQGNQIEIKRMDDKPVVNPAPRRHGNSKYYVKNVFGCIGDNCTTTNFFGTDSRGKMSMTASSASILLESGEKIGTVNVSGFAVVTFSNETCLNGIVHLSVSDEAQILLPNGQVHHLYIHASGSGKVVARKKDTCLWASMCEIDASDQAHVSDVKTLTDLIADAKNNANVSVIVAKDAITRTSGNVELIRVK